MAKKGPATLFWSGADRQYIWQQEANTQKRVVLSAQEHVFRLLEEDTSFSFQGQQGHLNLLTNLGESILPLLHAAGQQSIAEEETAVNLVRQHEQLLAARLLIAQGEEGKVQQALSILASWRAEAQSQARLRSEVEVLLIMARAYERLRRKQEAVED